jgi:hypothetical protein
MGEAHLNDKIIEGQWDDLISRPDLQGRRVRVIVLDAPPTAPVQDDEWLKRFHAWANSHKPVGHFVDDSRESIYSGTVDDPR